MLAGSTLMKCKMQFCEILSQQGSFAVQNGPKVTKLMCNTKFKAKFLVKINECTACPSNAIS